MKFEHFALNVPDSRALGAWYARHAGWQIARAQLEAPYKHFLADDSGRVTLEVYYNPAAAVPDFAAEHPLCFHIALYSVDARADSARFVAAGATHFLDEPQPDGSLLIMLRDPWGIPLQLCQRAQPFPGF